MKKFGSLFVALSMILVLSACGGNDNTIESTADSSVEAESNESQEESSETADSSKESEENSGLSGEQTASGGSLDILTSIWASYSEDEKFPIAGGDYDEANSVMDAPGNFGLQDTGVLDSLLAFPAASVDKIDNAASMMHMMNANTFTCGAYHVGNADDVQAVADALKESIAARQWMCGFPDKMIVIGMDDYVIAAFGNQELIDTFLSKTLGVYEGASVLYDEPIV